MRGPLNFGPLADTFMSIYRSMLTSSVILPTNFALMFELKCAKFVISCTRKVLVSMLYVMKSLILAPFNYCVIGSIT